jgi:hypothetical protein
VWPQDVVCVAPATDLVWLAEGGHRVLAQLQGYISRPCFFHCTESFYLCLSFHNVCNYLHHFCLLSSKSSRHNGPLSIHHAHHSFNCDKQGLQACCCTTCCPADKRQGKRFAHPSPRGQSFLVMPSTVAPPAALSSITRFMKFVSYACTGFSGTFWLSVVWLSTH